MPSGPWIVIKQHHYAASEPNEPTILWLILVRWLRPSDALQGLPSLDKAHTLVLGPLRWDKGSKELISGTILAGNSMVLFKCFLQQAFEYYTTKLVLSNYTSGICTYLRILLSKLWPAVTGSAGSGISSRPWVDFADTCEDTSSFLTIKFWSSVQMIAFDHVYSICVSIVSVCLRLLSRLGLVFHSKSSCQGCAHNITRKPSEMLDPELPELMRASSSSDAGPGANLSYSAGPSMLPQWADQSIFYYIYYFMYMGVVRKTFGIGVTSADMDLWWLVLLLPWRKAAHTKTWS